MIRTPAHQALTCLQICLKIHLMIKFFDDSHLFAQERCLLVVTVMWCDNKFRPWTAVDKISYAQPIDHFEDKGTI